MGKKYIFLDIDGTMVDYQGRIPESTVSSLCQAHQNGHELIVSTGRIRPQIYPELWRRIPFDGALTSTGASVERGDKTIYQAVMNEQQRALVMDYFDREGIACTADTADRLLCDSRFPKEVLPFLRTVGYSDALIESAYGDLDVADDLRARTGILKFSYFLSKKTTEQMMADLDGQFYIVDYSVGSVASDYYFGELVLPGVNKGSAMLQYLAHVGASAEDAVAIGDSGNDLDIIRAAGIGVAMGNATEPIKRAADLITTAVDDDGIQNALLQLGLI